MAATSEAGAGRCDQALGYAAVLTCQLASSRGSQAAGADLESAARALLAQRKTWTIPAPGGRFEWSFADADVPEIVSRAMALAEGVEP